MRTLKSKATKKELKVIATDLLAIARELLPVVSRKASTGACLHDGLAYGQKWEDLNKQLCDAINQAVDGVTDDTTSD